MYTDIFAHTILEVDFPNFEEIHQDLKDLVSSKFNENFVNEYDGHDHPLRHGAINRLYQIGDTVENTSVEKLLNFVNKQGKDYWNKLNLSTSLNPYVLQLWATATKRGGFHASHNHNPVPVAGVFYVEASPEEGNLFLENPLDLVLGKSAYQSSTQTPTRFNYEVEAKSGKLVLFPGWMKHFTRPNPTDNLRISVAVNFGCQGEVKFTEFV